MKNRPAEKVRVAIVKSIWVKTRGEAMDRKRSRPTDFLAAAVFSNNR